jgi:hypothetical protein
MPRQTSLPCFAYKALPALSPCCTYTVTALTYEQASLLKHTMCSSSALESNMFTGELTVRTSVLAALA